MHLMKLRIEAFGEHGEYAGQRDFCTVSHNSARQVLTIVRDPRAHVYSQYTHCLTAPGNKPFGQESMPTNVTLWLETNVRDAQLAAKSFHCGFDPRNMQTERFSCGKGFDVAAKHLDEAFFVGVSELYPESVCVLASKVDGALPRGCNCEMRERMHLTSYAHDVQKHSLANLTAADLALIDELTREDVQLYELARQRLLREIAEVEAKHNVTLRCGADAPRTLKRAYCMR